VFHCLDADGGRDPSAPRQARSTCREHALVVGQASAAADHQKRYLERLFEHGLTYTSGPTVRQANVRRGTHKPSTTRRCTPEARGLVSETNTGRWQCSRRPTIEPMSDNSGKTALVTGASSGIGEATALQLAELGYTVYAGARRVDRMSDLAARGIRTKSVDVTEDGSMVALVETIIADTGRIDALINNAGYGMYGALEDVPIEEARRQFEVNVFGLARLTQLVLPHMRAQRDGYIVNISSMGGKIWEPLGSWYHASKFAVEGLSDSLRVEVAEFGIKVVIIEPGTIRSEWADIAAAHLEATSANTPYARQAKLVAAGLRAAERLIIAAGPEVVAEVIGKAVQDPRPRTRYTAGGGARAFLLAERILPDRGFDRIIQLGYRLASRSN
jgi:NAD(P)-dependent dehydrogenase (short-subunit alcohol dehydrogenase family)